MRATTGAAMAGKTAFVTVGTTKFDALIKGMDCEAVADALVARGYTALIMQIGAGSYRPHILLPHGERMGRAQNGLHVEVFDFAPSLGSYMAAADLVISHAGSGSIFEALRLGKVLIAVPNGLLMHNHQAELARHMTALGHVLSCAPEALPATIQTMEPLTLRPYPPGSPSGIVHAIDKLMGF